ncbi:MAG: hypothetical protein JWR38_2092 [Mucilaginibacter sp.]|nr:hypothetical protein [Mucilaginibacter sp.]
MSGLLKRILIGDTPVKEYTTVTVDGEIKESVFLKIDSTVIDVSKNQFLLCLDPIIFGIWIEKGEYTAIADPPSKYLMSFKNSFTGSHGKTTATLVLDLIAKIDEKDGSLILLKLRKSRIYHLHFIKTYLLFFKYYKKPKLTFPQLKAFVAAYSYPRRVRVISFKQGDYFNIFPMDLLGDIQQGNRYIFGLRHTNTALAKIIATKKIVVSEVPYQYKDVIYQLGSHHSAGPPPVDKLPFKVISSKNFGFYVPEWANSYKEINIVKSINLGSHMMLWGEVQDKCALKTSTGHLFHIHHLLYLYQKEKGIAYRLV